MNKFNVALTAILLAAASSASALAQGMPESDYKMNREKIAADLKAAKSLCGSSAGNQNDICMAEANGKEKIARAELEAAYMPTGKTRYQVRIAKTEAEYAVARERCDELTGTAKAACVKDAKLAEDAGKADAKTRMNAADSSPTAGEYIDDSVITAKVKAAILEEPTLKVAEVNVETYKGIVQLSGFVTSQDSAAKAVEVAGKISGVVSVKNDMRLK
ncbi:conserved exported hypothetical protein [Rhodospirillaceae bacterium LM-1]|nr:conserved exported hypothetical protein [Rhodospirillaceae bacterium LM-1]